MLFIIILLIGICLILWCHTVLMQREMKSATEQLRKFLEGETGQKVEITLFNKSLNALIVCTNKLIEQNIQTDLQRQSAQQELRDAVANISHDLRTPLTSIMGYIQLLAGTEPSGAERREYIHIIQNRALRLNVLISDFFELSLIESEDYPFESRQLNLTALVKETLLDNYDRFKERNIDPVTCGLDREYLIFANEAAVRRVIENLIGNAVKYSADDVCVNLFESEEDIELCISNKAPSLSQKDASQLFERFYVADKTRSGTGRGLGLPIARSLMQKMNGTVDAKIKEDKLVVTCRFKCA